MALKEEVARALKRQKELERYALSGGLRRVNSLSSEGIHVKKVIESDFSKSGNLFTEMDGDSI